MLENKVDNVNLHLDKLAEDCDGDNTYLNE